jgi:hypothetical protein
MIQKPKQKERAADPWPRPNLATSVFTRRGRAVGVAGTFVAEHCVKRVRRNRRKLKPRGSKRRDKNMLWTILVVLLVLWLLGLIGGVAGNLIHLLLVVALVILVINLLTGRRTV